MIVSVDLPATTPAIEATSTRASRILVTGGGAGFTGATQIGIDAADTEFVLLLNDDAWLEPGALPALVDAVAAQPTRGGAAPKILFEHWPEILNSLGTVLGPNGWADSRGIGQPDVGQYDRSERVFGLHFAAAVVRRALFEVDEVGPLDLSFGSYYEDIDWCLRANLRGYEFVSVPDARARHGHSTTVDMQPFGFQFGLQQRNLIWTVAKSFEARHAARAIVRRTAALTRTSVRRRTIAPDAARALRQAMAGLPGVLRRRWRIQRRRVVRDAELFALSEGESSWFNQRSGPILERACLVEALQRRGDDESWVRMLRAAVIDGDRAGVEKALIDAPRTVAAYCERLGLTR